MAMSVGIRDQLLGGISTNTALYRSLLAVNSDPDVGSHALSDNF